MRMGMRLDDIGDGVGVGRVKDHRTMGSGRTLIWAGMGEVLQLQPVPYYLDALVFARLSRQAINAVSERIFHAYHQSMGQPVRDFAHNNPGFIPMKVEMEMSKKIELVSLYSKSISRTNLTQSQAPLV